MGRIAYHRVARRAILTARKEIYIWTEAEIDGLLGADADLFKRTYDVKPGGNWEGETILNRSNMGNLSVDDETRLAAARTKLRRTGVTHSPSP